MQGEKRLLSALGDAYPEALQAKEIARVVGLSPAYVRRLLLHAKADGKVACVRRGWYAIATPNGGVDVRIENVVLVAHESNKIVPRGAGYSTLAKKAASLSRRPTKPGSPTSDNPTRQTRLDRLTRKSTGFAYGPNAPMTTRTFFREWSVYFQEFPNWTTTCQVGAIGGPSMTVLDFLEFSGWLAGFAPHVPDTGPTGWTLQSWELNRDFAGLRLDRAEIGGKAVSLRVFRNLLVKFYEKATGLRVEVRQSSVDVPLRVAVEYARELAGRFATLGLLDSKDLKE